MAQLVVRMGMMSVLKLAVGVTSFSPFLLVQAVIATINNIVTIRLVAPFFLFLIPEHVRDIVGNGVAQ